MLTFFWILAALAAARLLIRVGLMLVLIHLLAVAVALPAGLLVLSGTIRSVPAFAAVCAVWALVLCAAGGAGAAAVARRRDGHPGGQGRARRRPVPRLV